MTGFLAALFLLAMGALPACAKPAEHHAPPKPAAATPKPATSQPAKKKLADTIWDYSRTIGTAHASYDAVKAEPELMSKLFCYCGCDVTEKMTSLLTCFQSVHGVECSICQDEAMFAYKLKKAGSSDAEIRKQVDRKFSSLYPFSEQSEILKLYKGKRE